MVLPACFLRAPEYLCWFSIAQVMRNAVSTMNLPVMNNQEFELFQKWIFQQAGISISPVKKALVTGRLMRRVNHHGMRSFLEYYQLLKSHQSAEEEQIALDLLTTNETYFFREPKHFDFLRNHILSRRQPGAEFRVWSAACSSGEEPYSIAMELADCIGEGPWDILATDISSRMIEKARSGLYAMERIEHISKNHLKRYCLKGVGKSSGSFLIDKPLRSRIQFSQINLNTRLPMLGKFDVIFLRNVMIYFNATTKREVVIRLLEALKPGGYLFIGHSESLHGLDINLRMQQPSVYVKS